MTDRDDFTEADLLDDVRNIFSIGRGCKVCPNVKVYPRRDREEEPF